MVEHMRDDRLLHHLLACRSGNIPLARVQPRGKHVQQRHRADRRIQAQVQRQCQLKRHRFSSNY